MKQPHIEVILPVYNEVNILIPLIHALDEAAAKLKDRASVSYLFINDGSLDGTSQLLYRIYKERKDIRIVDLIHNFGHGAALSAGIDHFIGDIAVMMDADGQDSPGSIVPFFEAWTKGAKTVVAERKDRPERYSYLFKGFYFLLHKISPKLPPIDYGTHCLLDRTIVERIKNLPERNRYFPGLVGFASNKVYSIPFARGARAHGNSRVGMLGLINLSITAFLGFSNAPIRLVSILGLFSAAIGFLMGISVVVIKLFTPLAIPGWASTIVLMSLSSGIELFCLGLIGEYLARVYEEVKERPLYLVDRVLDHKEKKKEAA